MASVGKSWAVLQGNITGDRLDAIKNLLSMSPEERDIKNKTESRRRYRKIKKPYMLGSKK